MLRRYGIVHVQDWKLTYLYECHQVVLDVRQDFNTNIPGGHLQGCFAIKTVRELFRFFVGQEAGHFCATDGANTLSHSAALCTGFFSTVFDGALFAALDAIAFEFHFSSPVVTI